jgi:acetoin utilization protein AcuB
MRIRDVMTKNPITVDPDTLIHDAQKTMQTHKIRRLPVVKKGKVVGLVTQRMLLEASPSAATSLSVWEIHYLLAKMRVKDIMVKDPLTLDPDMPFEKALILGQKKGIGASPVVENGKLVGIATEGDIIRILTQVLGLGEEGMRLTIEGLGVHLDELAAIIAVVNQHKTPILSMMSMSRPERKDWIVVIRVKTVDGTTVTEDLKKEGFNVTYVG